MLCPLAAQESTDDGWLFESWEELHYGSCVEVEGSTPSRSDLHCFKVSCDHASGDD